MADLCQLWLTCKDSAEADAIAKQLLDKKLVVCAKQLPVSSDFLWNGKVDHNNEILLVMDSREDLFEEVEAEVSRLHSYETFVLQAVPVVRTSREAIKWMEKEIQ